MDPWIELNYSKKENDLYLKCIEVISEYIKFEREMFDVIFSTNPTDNKVVNETISHMFVGNAVIKETLKAICETAANMIENRKLESVFDRDEE